MKRIPFTLVVTVLLCATVGRQTAFASEPANSSVDSVRAEQFGKLPTGETVHLYTLTNGSGDSVSIMDYGATVVRLMTKDKAGHPGDICLGFDTFDPYLTKSPYFGATIGRCANRIAKGKFELEGKSYQLATNNGPNALHGGLKGFDKQLWKGEIISQDPPSVRFTRHSPDGEEGYPGNLDASVTFRFTDRDELEISYEATTDKSTVVNLTNHTYFNLAGQGTILDHILTVHASSYTPVDTNLIPTGEIKSVQDTPFDFQQPTAIGIRLKAAGGSPVGYDHNYVLVKHDSHTCIAEVTEPTSGRWMKIYTDQPGLQFYSGNFLDGTVNGKGGTAYQQYDAFCAETQHFPDSPNHDNFPSVVLKPKKTYRTHTVYAFGAK